MSWKFSSTVSYTSRDIPFDTEELMDLLSNYYQPENEYEALMQAAPFEEPTTPKNYIDEIYDIVLDCLEVLLDQDKFIILAINYEQVTYEELGARLGVSATHAWRLKQIAYKHLEEVLLVDGRVITIFNNRR